MPTTANYAFYTPPLTGVTPDVPRDTKTLADQIDVALKAEETARIAGDVPVTIMADRYQATLQSIPNNAGTAVKFETAVTDGIPYNNTTGVFTIGRAGRYQINASVTWTPNGTGVRLGYIMVNGTNRMRLQNPTTTASNASMTLSKGIVLAVNDLVFVQVFQTSGAGLNLDNTNRSTSFDISYVGPA